MKTEELILIGLGAYLLLSNKSTPATVRPGAVMAGQPVNGNSPGGIVDQITSISGSVSDLASRIGGIVSSLPTFGGSDTNTAPPAATSFDPGDPGNNRQISPLGYRAGVSPLTASATTVGVPGSTFRPAPPRRAKTPAGSVPYSPFGSGVSRIRSLM